MKKQMHPDYHPVVFQDASTGKSFLTRSTVTSDRTVEWEDGSTYPLLVVDVTSDSHPFWTGAQRVMDTAGRVEKFERRYGKRKALWMAVPKRKMSRSNTRSRRAQWKATAPDLVEVTASDRPTEFRADWSKQFDSRGDRPESHLTVRSFGRCWLRILELVGIVAFAPVGARWASPSDSTSSGCARWVCSPASAAVSSATSFSASIRPAPRAVGRTSERPPPPHCRVLPTRAAQSPAP